MTTTTTTKHTPGTWINAGQETSKHTETIRDDKGRWLADCIAGNGEMIVRAVNNHAALLEALQAFEEAFDKWYCDSGHLCALLDELKQASAKEETKREVIRLQNLLVISVKARAAIQAAVGQP